MTIIPDHLNLLDSIQLDEGAHDSREGGMCALEAVAWLVGEDHTDRPSCVSPVIAAFGRAWNDALPDGDRDRILKPLLVDMVGTAAGPDVDERLAWMATDWLVRVHTPAWLRLAGLNDQAEMLANLPPLSADTTPGILPALKAVRQDAAAARDAARDAAGAATWAAARAAAWDAARAAAWDAARAAAAAAARDAARDAAGDATWAAARAAAWDAARAAAAAAARDAARDAAWAALQPTVTHLQESATDLLRAMCAQAKEA